MQEFSLIAIKDWEQLYHLLETTDPHQVKMMDFMADADSELTYESRNAYSAFYKHLEKILSRCPLQLIEPLQSIFFSMTSIWNNVGAILDELPMQRVYQSDDWGLEWKWVEFSLSPTSVSVIANAASQINLGTYRPYCHGTRFDTFEMY